MYCQTPNAASLCESKNRRLETGLRYSRFYRRPSDFGGRG